jgi:hypothetical protein
VTALWFWAWVTEQKLPVVADKGRPLLPERGSAANPHPAQAPLPRAQSLEPSAVRDPDILVLVRKDANEARRLAAQAAFDKVAPAIRDRLAKHPDASNNEIADWTIADRKTGPLVAHLKRGTLAKWIGKLRE